MGNKAKDLSGKKYGKLTPIKIAYRCRDKFDDMRVYWECECECGNVCVVNSRALTSGKTKSCGCLRKGINKKHGYYGTRLYRLHQGMKSRCKYPSCQDYKYYGGRGITYCEEWESFENFCEWSLSTGYNDNLSLERIDVNGNYEPSNCCWVEPQEQRYNMTTSRKFTINGETKCLAEWCQLYNINYQTVYGRITKYNFDILRALTEPTRTYKKRVIDHE